MKLVMKFGGTSMGRARDTIRHCADLVLKEAKEHQIVTTVSAMSGVTDKLLEMAAAAAAGNRATTHTILGALRQRHEETARTLGATNEVAPVLDRLEALVHGIAAVGELTPRSKDAVVAFGEKLSTPIMAKAIGGQALTGGEVGIVTDEHFGEARPLMNLSFFQIREKLEPILAARQLVVVTGFIAATQHGVTTTLGRGGSDYTGTILGAALKADEIWIWSDVDGLMTADPRIVPSAKLLSSITFAEALEMGQFGAKSMHPRALEPAAEHMIPVRMRNTFKPECPGTLITAEPVPATPASRFDPQMNTDEHRSESGGGISSNQSLSVSSVSSVDSSSSSVSSASSVDFSSPSVSPASSVDSSASPLRPSASSAVASEHIVRAVLMLRGSALVTVSGAEMVGRPGTAAAIFHALAADKINVQMISQTVSEAAISFAIAGSQLDRARTSLQANLLRTGAARHIDVSENVAVVAVVGAGMKGHKGVAARVFGAIARKDINVIAIAQGSSELTLSFVVKSDEGPEAVRALHEEFNVGG